MDGHYKQIELVYEYLFGKTPVWNFHITSAWEKKLPPLALQEVREYRDWLGEIHEAGWNKISSDISYVDLVASEPLISLQVSDRLRAIAHITSCNADFLSKLLPTGITRKNIQFLCLRGQSITSYKKNLLRLNSDDWQSLLDIHQASVAYSPDITLWEKLIYRTMRQMRKGHMGCINAARNLRDCMNSDFVHRSQFILQKTCPREVFVNKFGHYWATARATRCNVHEFLTIWREQLSWKGRSLERWDLCHQGIKYIKTYDDDGRLRFMNFNYWALAAFIVPIANKILEQAVIASAWQLFEGQSEKRDQVDISYAKSPLIIFQAYGDDIAVYIFGRTPSFLPDWITYDASPSHAVEVSIAVEAVEIAWSEHLLRLSDERSRLSNRGG